MKKTLVLAITGALAAGAMVGGATIAMAQANVVKERQENRKQTGAAMRAIKTIVEGKLAIPSDIAVVSENGKEVIHVADVFSYRTVDGSSGAVTDVLREAVDDANGYRQSQVPEAEYAMIEDATDVVEYEESGDE